LETIIKSLFKSFKSVHRRNSQKLKGKTKTLIVKIELIKKSAIYQIFVSHSRYDKDIRKDFNEIFGLAGVQSVCMEFENMQSPEWQEIKNAVHNSEAVFLLLGPNVNRSIHTQNWIAFEVGLACAFNKRIWVFEQVCSNVPFPIPYLTDYMVYNLEEISHFNYGRSIIEAYRQPDTLFVKRNIPKGVLVNCPQCHSTFVMHTDMKAFSCPSCRSEIEFCE
jgi:hypothetical protein